MVPLRDPRGRRPAFRSATVRKEIQQLVLCYATAGMKTDQIADLCGVDAKTLRKYFSRELDNAAMLLEAQAVQVLVHKMRAGNVSAAKAVREIAAAQAGVRARAAQQKQPKPAPVGKKEHLATEARTPPPGWGDLLN